MTQFADRHLRLVQAVNDATTEAEHRENLLCLHFWRDGAEAAGARPDYMAIDGYYMERGVDRPMCCGVFLDWTPANGASTSRATINAEAAMTPKPNEETT